MNERLRDLLRDKSEEWRAGFFAAVNFSSGTKAAFLRLFIGEQVLVVETQEARRGVD